MVTITVSDNFGRSVPGAKIALTSVVPQERFTGVGGQVTFDRVPFGVYDLDVQLIGFVARKERLNIYRSGLVFRVGLELGATHSFELSELSGSVGSDLKSQHDLWIRLVPLFSSDFVEDAVDSAGRFELSGMATGKYLLLLLQKDRILTTMPVDILGGKQTLKLTLSR